MTRRCKKGRSARGAVWYQTVGVAPTCPCHWCLRELTFDEATLDHEPPLAIDPLSRSCVIACRDCNSERGSALNAALLSQRRAAALAARASAVGDMACGPRALGFTAYAARLEETVASMKATNDRLRRRTNAADSAVAAVVRLRKTNDVLSHEGNTLRDVIRDLLAYGVCPEWPGPDQDGYLDAVERARKLLNTAAWRAANPPPEECADGTDPAG